MIQIFRVDFRDREAVAPEMPREGEECRILLAHRVENANRGLIPPGKPDNFASGGAEFALRRLDLAPVARENAFQKACSKRP